MVRLLNCLFSLFLVTGSAAQSLTIQWNGTNKVSIQAAAPANVGFRLQASGDGENWQDVSDQAASSLSYSVEPAESRAQFFRLRTFSIQDTSVTVILVGDSTVADFASNNSEFYGWGQGMYDHLKPNVQLFNFGTPAQSSLSFLGSIQEQNMTLVQPDFVLVQFGMMDTWEQDGLYTSLSDYETNLGKIVQIIREFHGTPILVTPPTPAYFNGTSVVPYLQDRAAVVRRVSLELQTYLIDLNRFTAEFFNRLGPAESARIFWSDTDRTHFSQAGSEAIAGLVVNAFPPILSAQVLRTP